MGNNKHDWSALSLKDKADLFKIYINNGISDLNTIVKHYNAFGGPLYNEDNPIESFNGNSTIPVVRYKDGGDIRYGGIPLRNEEDYYTSEADVNMKPDSNNHFSSRNLKTGRLLKSENHETFDKMINGEFEAGYNIYRDYKGDLYSFGKEDVVPVGMTNVNKDFGKSNYIVNQFGNGGDTNNDSEKSVFRKFIDYLFNNSSDSNHDNRSYEDKRREEFIKFQKEQVNHWSKNYDDLPDGYKQYLENLVKDYNFKEGESVKQLYDSGKLNAILEAQYGKDKIQRSGRIKNNDSPTKIASENFEEGINRAIYWRKGYEKPNMQFAIPYIDSLEVKVPKIGRVSTNALDSIAKYANEANLPLKEALGLSAQETNFGATPLYNMKNNDSEYNRLLANTSYFRNYGVIPAENLVRDFRYNISEDPISRNIPPLLHAFQYYKSGNYNRGDKNHTTDVINRGEELMKTEVIKNWIENSEYAKKALSTENNDFKIGGKINNLFNSFNKGGDTNNNDVFVDKGGWSKESEEFRKNRYKMLDPTGRAGLSQILYLITGGNQARGEENEYWKTYLGLESSVPKMNPAAKTSWDDAIEKEKIANGEMPSDFYGTTPRMDLNIQSIADTLNVGKIYRNYDEYKSKYPELPSEATIERIYETGKKVLDNPNTWQQVDGDNTAIKKKFDPSTNEANPLGMLANFGLMWSPEDESLYMHDTYDFNKFGEIFIGKRPKEMKIRGKIKFNPKKGSLLLRNDMENFDNYPKPITTK